MISDLEVIRYTNLYNMEKNIIINLKTEDNNSVIGSVVNFINLKGYIFISIS